MEYIPINSFEDIDLTKISIRDINNRYIDREGNRYATRFNMSSRKIEVVRIVKGRAEALKLRQQILKDRGEPRRRPDKPVHVESGTDVYSESVMSGDDIEYTEGLDYPAQDHHSSAAAANDTPFIENKLIEEVSHDLDRVRERSQGIVNNLKKSKYFDAHHESEFTDIIRDVDLACWQKPEEAVNFYRELYSYPRSVGYYAARLTGARREKVDKIDSEEGKLELIRRWETQDIFESTYSGVVTAATRLFDLLKTVTDADLKTLHAAQSMAFNDARTAAEFMIKNSRDMQAKIELWKRKFP